MSARTPPGRVLSRDFAKKVIVNRAGESGRAPVGGIVDRVIAERDIADHGVEEIVRKRRILEALGEQGRVGIEAFGNARGDVVEFDAGSARAGEKLVRHKSEEVAHSHGGFENLRAWPKAKALHGLPDARDYGGRGVVSIGSRGAGGFIFGVRQQLAEFLGGLLPFGRRVGAEGIRHRAPAGVFHEQGFFRVGRRAAFGFDALQRADGFDIVESLVAEAAFANPERVGYSEIAGRGWVWLGVGFANDGGSGSSGRNAHSLVANSQAAWYSIFCTTVRW